MSKLFKVLPPLFGHEMIYYRIMPDSDGFSSLLSPSLL
jgi:hypothetical protein